MVFPEVWPLGGTLPKALGPGLGLVVPRPLVLVIRGDQGAGRGRMEPLQVRGMVGGGRSPGRPEEEHGPEEILPSSSEKRLSQGGAERGPERRVGWEPPVEEACSLAEIRRACR